VMDGDAMIRAIRKMNSQIRIIAASGLNTDQGGVKPALADSRTAHLQKPFTARELLWAMKVAASG
jgi:CheY-like chemotaxis protein